jgi:O-antigen/teichoic acid export membrane protein
MFQVYAAFRLGNTATKYVAEYRKKDPHKAGRILKLTMVGSLSLCGVTALSLLIASGVIADDLLRNPGMRMAIVIGAVMMFLTVYGNISTSALAGFQDFKAIAKANVLRGILTPTICIPLAYYLGLEGAILGLALVAGIVLIQIRVYLRGRIVSAKFPLNVQRADLWRESPVLWQFALPGFLTGVLVSLSHWTARVILIRQEAGYAQLGLFTAADQWRTMVLFLPAILAQVVLPILSEAQGSSVKDFREAIGIQIQAVCMIALPLTLLVMGFTEPLAAVFGNHYAGTERLIPLLMLSVFLYAVNQAIRLVYDGLGKRWMNLSMYLLWSVVYFFGSLYFVPKRGAFGLAIVYLLAELVLMVVQTVYVDLVMVKRVLRDHLGLFFFSIALLSISLLSRNQLSLFWAGFVNAVLLGIALVPMGLKLRRGFRLKQ